MGFTRLAIARPILIWMAMLAALILGLRAYSLLPAELNPRADIPILIISTVYPGAGSPEVESQVSKPLEDSVGTAPGVRNVSSSSQANVSILQVEFQLGINLDAAISDVRSRIDGVRSQLPTEIYSPVVSKLDINARPVLQLGLSSKSLDIRRLRTLADDTLRPRLERVNGVAAVQIVGGVKREIQVETDAHKLAQYGLTTTDVANSLKAAGRDIPSGAITQDRASTSVRIQGAFASLEALRNTQVLSQQRMQSEALRKLQTPPANTPLPETPLLVADVAEVRDGFAERTEINRVNGVEGITLVVSRASDSNTVKVVDAIYAALSELKAQLPAEINIQPLHDDAVTVRGALEDVNATLVLGALLAMGVVLLFLHNLRGTFIIFLAIPTCIVTTFLVMWAAGFTLNQISLLALSLSVGILVDDSIVVLESVTRHLKNGETPREAALNGRAEIGFADITTTLVDVVVFVPIGFMGGIVGSFFREFGLTIATATLISLVVSFSVTPMLAARWYKTGEEVEAKRGVFLMLERFYSALEARYRHVIAWALRHRLLVVLFGVIALVAVSTVSLGRLGTEFMPGSDQALISVDLEMPPGTSLTATDALCREIERKVQSLPDVKAEVANVGQIVGGFGSIPKQGSQFAQVTVFLKPKRGFLEGGERSQTDEAIAAQLRSELAPPVKRRGGRVTAAAVRSLQGLASGIQFQVLGDDMEALLKYAEEARKQLAQISGVIDPQLTVRTGDPELRAVVDRRKAAQYGIPMNFAGAIVRDSLTGNTESLYREKGEEFPIRVRLREDQRRSLADVRNITIGADNQNANQGLLLSDIATISRQTAPANIERYNGQRAITVTANLTATATLQDVANAFRKILDSIPHQGISYTEAGDAKTLEENIPHFVSALGLAIILVYIVMASLFNSLGTPFVIMFTLPMALIGAFGALALTGESLSLVSGIGIIMLVGLMGRNAILLLDYTNTLRARGMERTEALVQAGATRLRPILMTTTCTIVGMMPVALRMGQAAELRAPMAIAVIGGLLVSTLLTLIMIPVIYSAWDDMVGRRRRG